MLYEEYLKSQIYLSFKNVDAIYKDSHIEKRNLTSREHQLINAYVNRGKNLTRRLKVLNKS